MKQEEYKALYPEDPGMTDPELQALTSIGTTEAYVAHNMLVLRTCAERYKNILTDTIARFRIQSSVDLTIEYMNILCRAISSHKFPTEEYMENQLTILGAMLSEDKVFEPIYSLYAETFDEHLEMSFMELHHAFMQSEKFSTQYSRCSNDCGISRFVYCNMPAIIEFVHDLLHPGY